MATTAASRARSGAGANSHIERLTWNEICERFPDEWVVLVDTSWVNEQDFEFGTARVVAHHKRRKDASPAVKAAFRDHDEVGCFWTGAIRGASPRLTLS